MPSYNAPAGYKPTFGDFPNGDFAFEIEAATETVSKTSGAPMIQMKLQIETAPNVWRSVRAWLVFNDKPGSVNSLFAFCACVGLDFYRGQIECSDVVGKTGRARFRQQQKDRSYGEVEKWLPLIRDAHDPENPDDLPF